MKKQLSSLMLALIGCLGCLALPWLAALGGGLAIYLIDAAFGVSAPTFNLPVSHEHLWSATKWLAWFVGAIVAAAGFSALIRPSSKTE